MKIIVGLGNPEKKYESTYHNLGFIVAEKLAQSLGAKFSLKSQLRCTLAQVNFCGERVFIVKPTTYMNLSGECVKAVLDYFKADLKDLLVIYDDVDVDIGSIRVRAHGSTGTHNGMRNIALNLDTTEFARLRIGTKPVNKEIPIIDYVLSQISKDEWQAFDVAVNNAVSCATDFIKGENFDNLMCRYNAKV